MVSKYVFQLHTPNQRPEIPYDAAMDCLNCAKATNAKAYCANCGQSTKVQRAPIYTIVRDSLSDFFAFDSKIIHSIRPLLLSPGALTESYISGKRSQVIPPVRLYIFISFLFFFFTRPDLSSKTLESEDIASEDVLAGTNAFFEIAQNGLQNLPHFFVLAIPLIALTLHVLHRRPSTYFYDHLIFSLHIHTFLLTSLFALHFIKIDFLYTLFVPVYFIYWLLSIKRCYKRSWRLSALKAMVLFLCDPIIIVTLALLSFGKAFIDSGIYS